MTPPEPTREDAPRSDPAELLAVGLESSGEVDPSLKDTVASPREELPVALAELQADLPGDIVLLSPLGHGGMGVVYKARQKTLDRIVALKVIAERVANSPQFAERFLREARAMARLSHPNIVALYEFGRTPRGRAFLIMEYVDGTSLRHLMAAGRMKPEEALAIVPRICDALEYAHGEGVVHRDIKPENILLDLKGHVKIADFGLAKLAGAIGMATNTDVAVGTPHYMAPEQLERPMEVDRRADIFALGVMLYELLTGELPLGKFAAPSQRVAVDVRIDEVVLRALERAPEMRFQSAGELKSSLELIGSSPLPPPAPPTHAPATTEAPFAPRAVLILCILALAVIGSFMAARRPEQVELDPTPAQPSPVSVKTRMPGRKYHTVTLPGEIPLRFVWIDGGTFRMGREKSYPNEAPVRSVTLDGFWIGETEVTHEQWLSVVGHHPKKVAFPGNPKFPIERATFLEITQGFLPRFASITKLDARLPTEAEWEYACRAGTTTEFYYGDGDGMFRHHGWCELNSGMQPHPVAQKPPNPWGLFDMHGNVWEWCSDWSAPYDPADTINPKGPVNGTKRIVRGGSWSALARRSHSAFRYEHFQESWSQFVGFRLVVSAGPDGNPRRVQ